MKILVRGTNWIGDSVMSIPALRELRRIFPDSQIALHTRSWAYGLFRDADFIDEVITFDKHRWPVKDVFDNSRFLKPDAFELAVLFPNSFESALTTFLSRIPRRIGYNKDVRGLLLTDPVAVPEWKDRRHEVFYYLNLVSEVEKRVLGRDTVSRAAPEASLPVSRERISAARQALSENGVSPEQRVVILGPGSANSLAKRWPATAYAKLSDRLRTELGAAVVLVGSRDDMAVAREVVEHSSVPPVDLTGKTALDEASAILAAADLMVANDMGLAHIAPAVGTDTLVIFGPTDPTTTSPYSPYASVVRKPVECSPCMHRVCPIDHRCMEWLTADEVFDAAAAKLEQSEEEPEQAAGSFC
jgi:heptosyltransferase-2